MIVTLTHTVVQKYLDFFLCNSGHIPNQINLSSVISQMEFYFIMESVYVGNF